jgi:cell division protein FtsB
MTKKNQSNWQKLKRPLAITLLGLLLFVLLITGLVKNIRQLFNARQEINQIKSEISRLNNKNKEINQLVDYLDSREFLEEEARLKFDLKKPNEQIIVIKQPDSEDKEISDRVFDLPALQEIKRPLNHNPRQWFKYFFSAG